MAIVLGGGGLTAAEAPASPLGIATAVAEVVRRDAWFELLQTPWKPTQGIQVIDFNRQFGGGFQGFGRAKTEMTLASSGEIQFGLAGAGEIRVWIDGVPVFTGEFAEGADPVEYAYDRFRWPAFFSVTLGAGAHQVMVQVTASKPAGRFFLQACDAHGEVDERARFGNATTADGSMGWQITTLQSGDADPRPIAGWRPATAAPVEDFAVKPGAVFKKHSLVEWHYATGVTHLVLLETADATGDAGLRAQVDRLAAFTLEHLPRLRTQFEVEHAWRGANFRLFRSCLLDDTTAPALPFVELLRRGDLPAAASLVEAMLTFVLRQNPRLPDGTFCRDEPEAQTVWADDLFMSAAFLVRAADWKKDPAIWDEVVRQTQGFHRHLLNERTGLYWHGNYAARGVPAAFHWGRANGWMVWAMSECLRFLPRDHPGREQVLALHRQHLAALVRYQASSGLWHQVLDRPDSYQETSASAMFLLAMARGMKDGWLDRAVFAEPARRAWAGLQTRIDAKGVVHGICGGTAIGDSFEHYFNRPLIDHDPRGVGAVITAARLAAELPLSEKP